MPTLRIHNLQSPLYQGEPYSLLTSTDVVPGKGLGAAACVDWRVWEEVYKALAALNVSHPLCVGADIAGVAGHASSELPQTPDGAAKSARVWTVLPILEAAAVSANLSRASIPFQLSSMVSTQIIHLASSSRCS